MVRRKVLHFAVIISMLMAMVGVVLPARVAAAGLLINPTSIHFAPQQVGTQSDPNPDHIVTLTNTDAVSPVTIESVNTGSPHFEVTGDGCTGFVLQAGINDTCTFAVVFHPDTLSLGALIAEVEIDYDIGGIDFESDLSVSGTSTTPSFSIETPGSASPLLLDFGAQQISENDTGMQTAPKEVRFTNTGQGPVLFITKYFSGGAESGPPEFADYNFTGDTCFLGLIGEGQTCSIWIAFAPQREGEQDGEANFVILANGFPFDIGVIVKGTGVFPQGSSSPDQWDFGTQQVLTQSDSKVFRITNTGSGPLTMPSTPDIEGLDEEDFRLSSVSQCLEDIIIPVGGWCEFEVLFRPLSIGNKIARIELDDLGDGDDENNIISLNGTGVLGTLAVSAPDLDFGAQQVGSSAPLQVLTVSNISAYEVEIEGFEFDDFFPDFEIVSDTCSPNVLLPMGQAGDSCTVTVRFRPTDLGQFEGILQIEHNGNGGQSFVELAILVRGIGTTVAGSLDKTQLTFNPSSAGLWSAPQKVTFTNDGTGPIQIPADLAFDGGIGNPGFYLQSNACQEGVVLAPGAWCSFEVVFLPNGTPGPKIAALTITGITDFLVTLNAIVALGTITIDPNALAFGDQAVNVQSAPKTITVTNPGALLVLVTTASITGGDDGSFVASNNGCDNAVLMNGQSCTLDVSFKPETEGPKASSASFVTNAAGSPHNVPVTGNGIIPVPPAQYTVTANVVGTGCTSVTSPAGPYSGGDEVTVSVAYDTATTVFIGWTLDGNFVGFASPFDFTATGNHHILATCVAKPSFSDVNAATPYNDAIIQLAARGVIKGYGNGAFGPNDGILRAQMAAITVRLAEWNNLVKPNIFTDRCNGQGCVDDELWNAVAVTAFFQVARGYEDNTYRPFDSVANIQAVAFITRTMVELGLWEFQPDNPAIYPNVLVGTGHRVDISTYYHYAGAVPGTNAANNWAQWDQNSTRAFFTGIYWQAYQSYFGTDQTP